MTAGLVAAGILAAFAPEAPGVLPLGDLSSLCVCGQALGDLETTLGTTGEPLADLARAVAALPPERRPAAVECLRPRLDMAAILPDGGAILFASVSAPATRAPSKECGDGKPLQPCAAWVNAPDYLPAPAVYLAPVTGASRQETALVSRDIALQELAIWNGAIVTNGRTPSGSPLPSGTVYVGDRPTGARVYFDSGSEPLPYSQADLIGHLARGDLQTIAALARHAAPQPDGGRVLHVFAGLQAAASPNAVIPPPVAEADSFALARTLRDALPALERSGFPVPRVRLARPVLADEGGRPAFQLQVDQEPGDVPEAEAFEEPAVTPAALFVAAGWLLLVPLGCLLAAGVAAGVRRRGLHEVAVSADTSAGAVVCRFYAYGRSVVTCVSGVEIAAAAIVARALSVVPRPSWGTVAGAAIAVPASGVLLWGLARRHRVVGAADLARWFGREAATHWGDLLHLHGHPVDVGAAARVTDARLRTALLDAVEGPRRAHTAWAMAWAGVLRGLTPAVLVLVAPLVALRILVTPPPVREPAPLAVAPAPRQVSIERSLAECGIEPSPDPSRMETPPLVGGSPMTEPHPATSPRSDDASGIAVPQIGHKGPSGRTAQADTLKRPGADDGSQEAMGPAGEPRGRYLPRRLFLEDSR